MLLKSMKTFSHFFSHLVVSLKSKVFECSLVESFDEFEIFYNLFKNGDANSTNNTICLQSTDTFV